MCEPPGVKGLTLDVVTNGCYSFRLRRDTMVGLLARHDVVVSTQIIFRESHTFEFARLSNGSDDLGRILAENKKVINVGGHIFVVITCFAHPQVIVCTGGDKA